MAFQIDYTSLIAGAGGILVADIITRIVTTLRRRVKYSDPLNMKIDRIAAEVHEILCSHVVLAKDVEILFENQEPLLVANSVALSALRGAELNGNVEEAEDSIRQATERCRKHLHSKISSGASGIKAISCE